jgi:hypothetical protein
MMTRVRLGVVDLWFDVARELDTSGIVDHEGCRTIARAGDTLTVSAMASTGVVDLANDTPGYTAAVTFAVDSHRDT